MPPSKATRVVWLSFLCLLLPLHRPLHQLCVVVVRTRPCSEQVTGTDRQTNSKLSALMAVSQELAPGAALQGAGAGAASTSSRKSCCDGSCMPLKNHPASDQRLVYGCIICFDDMSCCQSWTTSLSQVCQCFRSCGQSWVTSLSQVYQCFVANPGSLAFVLATDSLKFHQHKRIVLM